MGIATELSKEEEMASGIGVPNIAKNVNEVSQLPLLQLHWGTIWEKKYDVEVDYYVKIDMLL